MADVSFQVAGHNYKVSCRDGEEDRLKALGNMVNTRAANIKENMGDTVGEARLLLLTALILADELDEAGNDQATPDTPDTSRIEALASRMEALSRRLAPETDAT